jgi:hypothetical protein
MHTISGTRPVPLLEHGDQVATDTPASARLLFGARSSTTDVSRQSAGGGEVALRRR